VLDRDRLGCALVRPGVALGAFRLALCSFSRFEELR
jgi:hypothetical protein